MAEDEKISGFPWQKILLYGALLAALYVLFNWLHDLITPTIVSVFLAFILNPTVDFLERRGLSRIVSIMLLYLAFFTCMVVLGVLLKNVMVSQVHHFKENLPSYKKKAQTLTNDVQKKVDEYRTSFGLPKPKHKNAAQSQGETMEKVFNAVSSQAMNIVSFLPNVFLILLIPLMTFFFLKDGRSIKKLLISFVPNRYFELALTLLYEVNVQIGMYIRGQLIDAACVAALFGAGLAILKVPYFFLLGPFAGLCNIIPYLGGFMGLISSALVAILTQDTFPLSIILSLIVLTIIVHIIDSIIIGPLVVGKSADVHPLVIIFALLAGEKAMGVVGMLIAVPVASSIKVIFYTAQERLKDFQVA